MQQYDYLILGSGIAGLYAALLASRHGSVGLVTKGAIDESNTKYAQGGIAAAIGSGDSVESHLDDTLTAGAGLCDREAVEVMVREAPDRIRRLSELGVPWDAHQGAVELGLEAAHSRARILHAGGDRTGDAIETVMVRQVREAGVEVFDCHTATDLLKQNGRVVGCVATTGEDQIELGARWTILATGGAGRLYTLTTNPEVATGDGVALAYRAGATVRDMEFVQFHPTALRLPGAPTFLLSEAMRGEGAVLRNSTGERFMARYDVQGDLAPRDVVSRAIATEMRDREADHVELDISHLDAEFVATRFPWIYQYCLQYELDITREAVPVAPAAHYMMGGVYTDAWGRTTLPGLLACGEVTSSGVHGANRLASNSLLETVVFAQRAVEVSRPSVSRPSDQAAAPPADVIPLAIPDHAAPINQEALQRLLWREAGIVRNRDGLLNARAVLNGLPASGPQTPAALSNMACFGRLVVEAALRREESRGAHFRTDFPHAVPAWRRHLSFVNPN
ncbi:MAG TPA: L-aspartate oxidase [Dehalococcoidia bacterium]|nr:L-aspartate oxidase [Dehalococcoidia bacterium]